MEDGVADCLFEPGVVALAANKLHAVLHIETARLRMFHLTSLHVVDLAVGRQLDCRGLTDTRDRIVIDCLKGFGCGIVDKIGKMAGNKARRLVENAFATVYCIVIHIFVYRLDGALERTVCDRQISIIVQECTFLLEEVASFTLLDFHHIGQSRLHLVHGIEMQLAVYDTRKGIYILYAIAFVHA